MTKYYLIDLERSISTGAMHYWRSHHTGYTPEIELAGLYTASKAFEIARSDMDGSTVPVEETIVKRILSENKTLARFI